MENRAVSRLLGHERSDVTNIYLASVRKVTAKTAEARVTVGFDPMTGKQVQRSITGKTQKEVAQKMMEAGDLWTERHLVFTNQVGDYLSYRGVYDCFKRIVRKIGCPNIRFHDMRHTYAVNCIAAGDDNKGKNKGNRLFGQKEIP